MKSANLPPLSKYKKKHTIFFLYFEVVNVEIHWSELMAYLDVVSFIETDNQQKLEYNGDAVIQNLR